MSEASLSPLMTTEVLSGIINAFPRLQGSLPLAKYIPLVNINADKVRMDIDKAMYGGMTPGVAPGTESPIYGSSGRAQREWDSAHFREKVIVSEPELIDRRRLGTMSELERATDVLKRKFSQIQMRLANRLEYMRYQTLFEDKVDVKMADGTSYTVNFPKPEYLNVTAGVLWDNLTTATPLDDLQLWVEDYQRNTGYRIQEIVAPMGFYRRLSACDEFKARATANTPAFSGSPTQVASLVSSFVGIPVIQEEIGRINFNAELTAAAAAAATTITLKNVDNIVAGTTILLRRMSDLSGEKVVVASVAGNVVTLSAGLSLDYAVGDLAGWSLFSIPENKLLFMGAPAGPWEKVGSSGEASGDLIANPILLASTYSRHVDLEPRPGMFVKQINKIENEDVPRIEMVNGISAMIQVNYSESWFTATFE